VDAKRYDINYGMFNERVKTLKCPEEVIQLIHGLLDDDISPESEKVLQEHLDTCKDCKVFFEQIKKTTAIFHCLGSSTIQAPKDFTAKVMASLPNEMKKNSFQRWLAFHPILTAASLFIILMTGSLISTWEKDQKFSVSKQSNLVVNNNLVTVPKGEIVKGDIIVKNGKLRIEGEVQGDVTVINGDQYVASAGKVTGDIEEVNKVFDWLWYHIKKTSNDMLSVFNSGEK